MLSHTDATNGEVVSIIPMVDSDVPQHQQQRRVYKLGHSRQNSEKLSPANVTAVKENTIIGGGNNTNFTLRPTTSPHPHHTPNTKSTDSGVLELTTQTTSTTTTTTTTLRRQTHPAQSTSPTQPGHDSTGATPPNVIPSLSTTPTESPISSQRILARPVPPPATVTISPRNNNDDVLTTSSSEIAPITSNDAIGIDLPTAAPSSSTSLRTPSKRISFNSKRESSPASPPPHQLRTGSSSNGSNGGGSRVISIPRNASTSSPIHSPASTSAAAAPSNSAISSPRKVYHLGNNGTPKSNNLINVAPSSTTSLSSVASAAPSNSTPTHPTTNSSFSIPPDLLLTAPPVPTLNSSTPSVSTAPPTPTATSANLSSILISSAASTPAPPTPPPSQPPTTTQTVQFSLPTQPTPATTSPPIPRSIHPVKLNTTPSASSSAAPSLPPRFAFPVFKPDGDIDTKYVNQQHVLRKRILSKYLLAFAFIYMLMEIPYCLHPHWSISDNYIPIILRVCCAILIYLGVVVNRQLYVARFIFHTQERFDFLMTAQMICSTVLLCAMETQRHEFGDDDTLDSILEDGLLLGLSLIYAFSCGIIKLGWLNLISLGLTTMATYTVTILVNSHITQRYLLLSLAYQFVLICSFVIISWYGEQQKLDTINQQKYQFLERKKAEKLLRSMLPTRILSDYLDGNIGQLQANATIGFVQMHLGALDDRLGTPGSHQPSVPPTTASPGELMQKLHDTFKRIDGIVSMYAIRGVVKIETVATTYLLCAGLLQDIDDHAAAMIDVSLEIMSMVTTRLNIGGAAKRIPVQMRIGISSGPVVGGIIGAQRRFFRVFGDTVNVAARMCTNVHMGCIQISPSCYQALNERQRTAYKIPPGTLLDIKGKGEMMCYRVESRADWVPKFSKSTMNRGQQDRDEPLLNKSFVYHKLMARTELDRWSLRYKQPWNDSGLSLEKQATFVREGSIARGMDGLASVPHHSLNSKRLRGPPTHSHQTNVDEKVLLAAAPDVTLQQAADGTTVVSRARTFIRARSGSMVTRAGGGLHNGTASIVSVVSPGGHVQHGGSSSTLNRSGSMNASSAEIDSPFSSHSIENFFQLSYAKTFLPEIRWLTLLLSLFQLGILVYVIEHHPGDWDVNSQDSISPVTMIAISLFCFLFFDLLSIIQSLWRSTCALDPEEEAQLELQQESSPPPLLHQPTMPNQPNCPPVSPGQGSNPSTDSNVSADISDEPTVDHFTLHLQTYSVLFYIILHAWVLLSYELWGIKTTTQIHPVFSMLLLTFFGCFSLKLQFRFLAPINSISLIIFGILIITDRMNYMGIILILFNLFVGLLISLTVLYLFERTARSNFVLAYGLEKEQEYMDQFLNNLLPKDVVLVLKKQNPSLAKEVVRVGGHQRPSLNGSKHKRGRSLGGSSNGIPGTGASTPGVRTLRNVGVNVDYSTTGMMRGSIIGGTGLTNAAGGGLMTPQPNSRLSISGPSMSLGTTGGGVASRFAMHFPRTTVFESDIVGYTQMVSNLSPSDTLNLLNLIFSRFDEVAHAYGVEKIETIGDAFMCMVFDGPPDPVLDFALQIVNVLDECSKETRPKQDLQIRMGICTGSCFGGIVGTEIPRFHLFGQAHDVAIHIEQNGRPGDIIVSSTTHTLSSDRYDYEPLDLIVDGFVTHLLKGRKEDVLFGMGMDELDQPVTEGELPHAPNNNRVYSMQDHFISIPPSSPNDESSMLGAHTPTAPISSGPPSLMPLTQQRLSVGSPLVTTPDGEHERGLSGSSVMPAFGYPVPPSINHAPSLTPQPSLIAQPSLTTSSRASLGSTTTSTTSTQLFSISSSLTPNHLGQHHTNKSNSSNSTAPTTNAVLIHTSVGAVASISPDKEQLTVISNQQFIDPTLME